jgi:hypothetical protein
MQGCGGGVRSSPGAAYQGSLLGHRAPTPGRVWGPVLGANPCTLSPPRAARGDAMPAWVCQSGRRVPLRGHPLPAPSACPHVSAPSDGETPTPAVRLVSGLLPARRRGALDHARTPPRGPPAPAPVPPPPRPPRARGPTSTPPLLGRPRWGVHAGAATPSVPRWDSPSQTTPVRLVRWGCPRQTSPPGVPRLDYATLGYPACARDSHG